MNVTVLTTGGTISSRRDERGIAKPGAGGAGIGSAEDVEVRDLFVKDSASFTLADMDCVGDAVQEALSDAECLGVVVVHGTDSMEETALLVDLFHNDPRPVVFTGAQRTADHARPDGPANVAAAVQAARSPVHRDRGVLIAFGGRILPAHGSTKGTPPRLKLSSAPSQNV